MEHIKLPIEEIIKKFENGVFQSDLATEYHVSYSTITNRIKNYYIQKGIDKPKSIPINKLGRKPIELPMKEIIEKFENGISQAVLASEYHVSYATIKSRINNYYIQKGINKPKRKTKSKIPKRKILPMDEIIKKLENDISPQDLATEYGVSYNTMLSKINKYYIEKGLSKPQSHIGRKLKELPIEEVIKKYENGFSTKELSISYNISFQTINTRINNYYKEKGIKTPRQLRSVTVISDFLSKGLSIDEIVETAKKRNIIIPQHIIDSALQEKNKQKSKIENER